MSRPKDACSEETWNRIVASAREELVETDQGEVDVSMRQVAARAGVSLGTIHYYFATKESLLEACLDAYYGRFATLVAGLAPHLDTTDPRGAIDLVIRGLYRFAVAERHSLKLRARINTHIGHLEPQRARHVRGPMLDAFSARIAAMGGLEVHEARLTIQTMTGLIMHFALLADVDVEQIAGSGGEAGRRILEDHVARVALRLVFPG